MYTNRIINDGSLAKGLSIIKGCRCVIPSRRAGFKADNKKINKLEDNFIRISLISYVEGAQRDVSRKNSVTKLFLIALPYNSLGITNPHVNIFTSSPA